MMKYPKRVNYSPKADARLNHILHAAARIISSEGYERATIRKVAKAAGMSLAGLYYYFSRKEELLFLIQFHTFDSLVDSLRRRIADAGSPEEKLRAMVRNHLKHFIENMHELRVCSHELETLSGKYYKQVLEKRKAYFHETLAIVEDLMRSSGREGMDPRLATLYLFGMLNWIYMWYDSERYQDADTLTEQMVELFMRGVEGRKTP
jgi:TetR/AcrR family transcriptional regulator